MVPGEAEEARGLIRHMGKITDVYATATVPKIGVVLREAYADAGSMIMGGLKGMGADLTYAWPIARVRRGGVNAGLPKGPGRGHRRGCPRRLLEVPERKVDAFDAAHSWTAQIVDEIILPKDTRKKIIQALRLPENKEESLPPRKKMHGSAPT